MEHSCEGTPGDDGQDRVTKTTFDAAHQATKVTTAYGTNLAQDIVSYLYHDNATLSSMTDAKGNKTSYEYDGFDRLVKTFYPHPTTAGVSSTTDFEQWSYNENSTVFRAWRRDGQLFEHYYDALGRLTTRDAPGAQPDVSYTATKNTPRAFQPPLAEIYFIKFYPRPSGPSYNAFIGC